LFIKLNVERDAKAKMVVGKPKIRKWAV